MRWLRTARYLASVALSLVVAAVALARQHVPVSIIVTIIALVFVAGIMTGELIAAYFADRRGTSGQRRD